MKKYDELFFIQKNMEKIETLFSQYENVLLYRVFRNVTISN